MKGKFNEAVSRDLSSEMNDEEGMFHLFIFEKIAQTVKQVVDVEVMEAITNQVSEMLVSMLSNDSMDKFREDWT